MGHCVHIGSVWGDFFPLLFVYGFLLYTTTSLPHPRGKHTQKESRENGTVPVEYLLVFSGKLNRPCVENSCNSYGGQG